MTPPVTPTRTGHSSRGQKVRATVPAPLKIDEVCTALDIARSTFYEWRAKGRAPRCIKLPNGEIRIRVADFESWLRSLEDVA